MLLLRLSAHVRGFVCLVPIHTDESIAVGSGVGVNTLPRNGVQCNLSELGCFFDHTLTFFGVGYFTLVSYVGTTGSITLAFPPPPPPASPCSHRNETVAIKAVCVAAGPPPPPPPLPPSNTPTNLRLQFLEAPVFGVDTFRPHFSWTPPAPSTSGGPSAATQQSAEAARLHPLAVQVSNIELLDPASRAMSRIP